MIEVHQRGAEMRTKIIVGPDAMRVERCGVSSDVASLDASQGPAEVRAIASGLWESIRPIVSWNSWVRHRLRMAEQRRRAADVAATWPGPYFRGPRPSLIATVPWGNASPGQWAMLPSGVVARLLRMNAGRK